MSIYLSRPSKVGVTRYYASDRTLCIHMLTDRARLWSLTVSKYSPSYHRSFVDLTIRMLLILYIPYILCIVIHAAVGYSLTYPATLPGSATVASSTVKLERRSRWPFPWPPKRVDVGLVDAERWPLASPCDQSLQHLKTLPMSLALAGRSCSMDSPKFGMSSVWIPSLANWSRSASFVPATAFEKFAEIK